MGRLILETSRTRLREFELDDDTHLFELNSDPEVVRYTGDGPFASRAAAREFLAGYDTYRVHGIGRWAVIARADGAFLGWCGLKRNAGAVDLGFRFHRRFWGQGFATETARASIALAWDQLALDELIAHAVSDNHASLRVLEKCGFRRERVEPYDGFAQVVHLRLRREPSVTN